MTSSVGVPEWVRAARDLYLVAIAVFFVNIVIGILNGADAVEFDRNQILTHVHAGTVGWLTLAIVAATTLLFRATDRRLVFALAVAVPVYVLAFYTGNFMFRAISGTVLLLVIGWLLVWLWREFLAGERSLPRLAVTLGLTSFGYGAVLGVLLQIAFAAGVTILPGDAHRRACVGDDLRLPRARGLRGHRVAHPRDARPAARRARPGPGAVHRRAHHLDLPADRRAAGRRRDLSAGPAHRRRAVRRPDLADVPAGRLAGGGADAPPRRRDGVGRRRARPVHVHRLLVHHGRRPDPTRMPCRSTSSIASDHAVYLGVITNGALGLLSILVA